MKSRLVGENEGALSSCLKPETQDTIDTSVIFNLYKVHERFAGNTRLNYYSQINNDELYRIPEIGNVRERVLSWIMTQVSVGALGRKDPVTRARHQDETSADLGPWTTGRLFSSGKFAPEAKLARERRWPGVGGQ